MLELLDWVASQPPLNEEIETDRKTEIKANILDWYLVVTSTL